MIPLKTFELREGQIVDTEKGLAIVSLKTPAPGGYDLILTYGPRVADCLEVTVDSYKVWQVEI